MNAHYPIVSRHLIKRRWFRNYYFVDESSGYSLRCRAVTYDQLIKENLLNDVDCTIYGPFWSMSEAAHAAHEYEMHMFSAMLKP